MSLKCPACGFDSPDAALYCDFCKEPFRGAPKAPVDPAAIELKPDPEQVPVLPPWARMGAWLFLGLWIIIGCIVAGVLKARYEAERMVVPVSTSVP